MADKSLEPRFLWNHICRATGITRFLETGGTLEEAANLANHADMRTTRINDKRGSTVRRTSRCNNLRYSVAEFVCRHRARHALEVERSIKGDDVVDVLTYLFQVHGEPEFIRSDNGPEFVSDAVRKWLKESDVKTLFIEPGSPWENAHIESFNSRLRDEFLNREIFSTLIEAQVLAEQHRVYHNLDRPHSSLGYLTPAEFAALDGPQALLPRVAGVASDSPENGEQLFTLS